MSNYVKISNAVIRRLPKYIRHLNLIESKGVVRVSSQELSDTTGFTASQIRQDLNHFGGFGQQGYGYNVKELRQALEEVVGLDKSYKAVLVGYGNLGRAIFNYYHESSILKFIGIFDINKDLDVNDVDLEISHIDELSEFLDNNDVDFIVITTPTSAIEELTEKISEKDIKGVWNFTPIDLNLPDNIIIEDVHLDESLSTLIYYMGNPQDYKAR